MTSVNRDLMKGENILGVGHVTVTQTGCSVSDSPSDVESRFLSISGRKIVSRSILRNFFLSFLSQSGPYGTLGTPGPFEGSTEFPSHIRRQASKLENI